MVTERCLRSLALGGLALALGGLATFWLPAIAVSGSADAPPVTRITVLTGEEAKDVVASVSKTNNRFLKAQARSAVRLSAKGYQKTDVVVVHRIRMVSSRQVVPANLGQQLIQLAMPTLRAQEYPTDEGTMILTSLGRR